jgi:hypothetical protein
VQFAQDHMRIMILAEKHGGDGVFIKEAIVM